MKRRKKLSQSTRVTKIDKREPEEKEPKTDEDTFNQTFSVVQNDAKAREQPEHGSAARRQDNSLPNSDQFLQGILVRREFGKLNI